MKGLSEVLVIVVILLITLSLISLAYVFMSDVFKSTTEAGTNQSVSTADSMKKGIENILSRGCGDSECSETEKCYICPEDCGVCPFCGDGTCGADDTCGNCPADCGVCPNIPFLFTLDTTSTPAVKVNTTTSIDRYNQSANTIEMNFSLADKDPSLISYHRFEGGDVNGLLDETDNNYDLSVTGGVNPPTWMSAGYFDGGMDFEKDYDQGLNNTAYFDLSSSSAYTICAWFNQESSTSSYMGVQLGQSPYNGGNGISLRTATQQFQIYVYTPITTAQKYAQEPSAHSLGTWYFVCGTVDMINAILYINGVVSTTNTGATGTLNFGAISSDRLTLGEPDAAYADSAYDGLIDEVKVYNRVLSAAEIKTLYNSAKRYINTGWSNSKSTWTSDTQTVASGYKLGNMTIDITATATAYLDKVEWLKASDNSIIASNETDIISSGLVNYSTANGLNIGNFDSVNEDFRIKLYFSSNGLQTPTVNSIKGFNV